MNISLGAPKGVILGAEPRANLLPPEVRQAHQARMVRRFLALLVVVTLLFVGGGFGAAAFRGVQAQGGLDNANARTAQLQKEKLSYAEATSLSNLVKTVKAAREVAVSREVMWNTYYDAIAGVMPAGVTMISSTMLGQIPWEAEMGPVSPLRVPRVAQINFVLSSKNVIDQTSVVRNLESIGGFGDVSVDELTLVIDGYTLAVTLNLSKAALSGRFAPPPAAEVEK